MKLLWNYVQRKIRRDCPSVPDVNTQQLAEWLEDPATYPVIAICGGACVGAFSYIAYKSLSCPDVQFDRRKRGTEIRYWGGSN